MYLPTKRSFYCYADGDGQDPQGGGAGDNKVSSWKDSLPEDIRGHAAISDINDIPNLVKSYINAQQLVGMDKVVLPNKEDDPLWNDVYNKLGRPESPDGYELKKDDKYPKDLEFNEEFAKNMSKVMHEAGLSKKQANILFGKYNEQIANYMSGVQSQGQQIKEDGIKSLKKEWGQAFDQNTQVALRAVKQFGSEELANYLNETGAGDDPRFIKLFYNIGKTILEDSSDGAGGGMFNSPAQAKMKITELHQDAAFMTIYNDKTKVGHNEAVEKMKTLFKQAYPET